jgi:hypothetical protein
MYGAHSPGAHRSDAACSDRSRSMFRIPITLVFEDGETMAANLYFPRKPTAAQADEVWQAAVELGKSKGAKHVLVPPPWGKP